MSIWMLASGGFGDIACSTCLLHYKEDFWPGKKIWWFAHPDCIDILKYNDKIDEVRVISDMRSLIASLKKDGQPDCEASYNTAPWQNGLLVNQGIHYTMIPMVVMKSFFKSWNPNPKDWHPYIGFSKEEDDIANAFIHKLPYKKTIMLETTCRSGQGSWDKSISIMVMKICREIIGPCNFLFASKSGFAGNPSQTEGLEAPGVCNMDGFTIRQCVPVYNRCQLFIGLSSGISCVTCSWQSNPLVERIEYISNNMFGTCLMARGRMATVLSQPQLFNAVKEACIRIKTT